MTTELNGDNNNRPAGRFVLLTSMFLFLFPLVAVILSKALHQKAEVCPTGSVGSGALCMYQFYWPKWVIFKCILESPTWTLICKDFSFFFFFSGKNYNRIYTSIPWRRRSSAIDLEPMESWLRGDTWTYSDVNVEDSAAFSCSDAWLAAKRKWDWKETLETSGEHLLFEAVQWANSCSKFTLKPVEVANVHNFDPFGALTDYFTCTSA